MGNTNDLKYIGTFQGKFTIRTSQSTEGAVSRINKLDKEVWEIQFNRLTGKLVEIKQKDGDYGLRYHFIIENGDMTAALETSLNSNLASSIINRLPNLDLTKPFEIVARWNASKERALFFVNQDGEEIKDFFQEWDADNKKWILHHKFPAWEKKKINGEDKWDSSKQIAYQQKVIERYMKAAHEAVEEAKVEAVEEIPQPQSEEEDDLPF